jgi:hypothetical protein
MLEEGRERFEAQQRAKSNPTQELTKEFEPNRSAIPNDTEMPERYPPPKLGGASVPRKSIISEPEVPDYDPAPRAEKSIDYSKDDMATDRTVSPPPFDLPNNANVNRSSSNFPQTPRPIPSPGPDLNPSPSSWGALLDKLEGTARADSSDTPVPSSPQESPTGSDLDSWEMTVKFAKAVGKAVGSGGRKLKEAIKDGSDALIERFNKIKIDGVTKDLLSPNVTLEPSPVIP